MNAMLIASLKNPTAQKTTAPKLQPVGGGFLGILLTAMLIAAVAAMAVGWVAGLWAAVAAYSVTGNIVLILLGFRHFLLRRNSGSNPSCAQRFIWSGLKK